MTPRSLGLPRRTFQALAVGFFLAMVLLIALGYLVPALIAGVLAVVCVLAGSRPTGGT